MGFSNSINQKDPRETGRTLTPKFWSRLTPECMSDALPLRLR